MLNADDGARRSQENRREEATGREESAVHSPGIGSHPTTLSPRNRNDPEGLVWAGSGTSRARPSRSPAYSSHSRCRRASILAAGAMWRRYRSVTAKEAWPSWSWMKFTGNLSSASSAAWVWRSPWRAPASRSRPGRRGGGAAAAGRTGRAARRPGTYSSSSSSSASGARSGRMAPWTRSGSWNE